MSILRPSSPYLMERMQVQILPGALYSPVSSAVRTMLPKSIGRRFESYQESKWFVSSVIRAEDSKTFGREFESHTNHQ